MQRITMNSLMIKKDKKVEDNIIKAFRVKKITMQLKMQERFLE